MTRKPVITFKKVYKKDGVPIEPPRLRNLSNGFIEESATLKEIGVIKLPNGDLREYQIIKVILKEGIIS